MTEKDYSLTDVKHAFWKTFHEAGEIWFNYLSSPEQNTSCTEEWWQTFQGYLREMAPEPDIISLREAGKELVQAAMRVQEADAARVLNLREMYLLVTDDPAARWGGRVVWTREPPLDASET